MRFSYADIFFSRNKPQGDKAHRTGKTPLGALISPAWISALVLLALNDHLFKGLYPGALTGKLSDFAGLFIAPALLAVLLSVKSRRGLIAGSIAIGAVFSAINLSPSLATMWDGAMSALLLPFHTTVDPTDLLALPALALGTLHASRALDTETKAPEQTPRRLPALALATIALFVCAASGGPTNTQRTPASFTGTVTILNKTNEMHQIEIYTLDQGVELDCDEVANNPDAILTDELFEGTFPRVVPLFSGEELAINPAEWTASWNAWDDPDFASQSGDCRAFLVRSRVLPSTLVFWRPRDFFTREYIHNASAPQELDPTAPTITIDADYSGVEDEEQLHGWREITCPLPSNDWDTEFEWDQCDELGDEVLLEAQRVPEGARYSLRSINDNVPLHFERPRFESGGTIQIPARCRTPGPGEGLDWEDRTNVAGTLDGVERGVDGCHTLHLTPATEIPDTFLVCGPWEAISRLQPPADADIKINVSSSDSDLQIRVQQGMSELGFGRMRLRKGPAEFVFNDYAYEMEVRIGCDPILESCGEVSLPIDLRLESTEGNILIGPGESVDLGPIRGEVFLARANYRPVANTLCEEADETNTGRGVYAEIVTIIR